MSLHAVVTELLLHAGRPAEAMAALEKGCELAFATGAHAWYIGFTEGLVKLRIVDDRDATESMVLLDELENDPLIEHALQLRAKARAWRGPLLLRSGSDTDAVDCLREAASLLKAGGLFLELPIVAVLPAEAEWRAGNEDAADRAADLALETSARQGSRHVLLKILNEFPAVASRRIDSEAEMETPWHAIGRALGAEGEHPGHGTGADGDGHGVRTIRSPGRGRRGPPARQQEPGVGLLPEQPGAGPVPTWRQSAKPSPALGPGIHGVTGRRTAPLLNPHDWGPLRRRRQMRLRRGPLHELQLDRGGRHVADGHQGAGGVGRRAGPALWCGQHGRHQPAAYARTRSTSPSSRWIPTLNARSTSLFSHASITSLHGKVLPYWGMHLTSCIHHSFRTARPVPSARPGRLRRTH